MILCFSIGTFAQDYHLGMSNFKATGDDVAQPYFEKGLLLLHNFEYEAAAQEFEMAQLLDPNFAMAYWGEAMCYNQPLWRQQDLVKAKGALYKLAVKPADRTEKAQTAVEKGLLASVELLFGEDGNLETRNEKYKNAMSELYSRFPQHEAVASFYALSILAASPSNNEKEAHDEAARILHTLNAVNPQHPGALNYLMHIYDNPAVAYKGKNAAEQYVQLATDSKYALHAPSHIFLATGDWEKTRTSNEAAWKAAEAWVKKNKKSLEDRDYHSLWWLHYGYLQQGKYKLALEQLANMNRDARYSKSERMRFHLAMMRGHFLVESGMWFSDVTQISVPTMGFSISAKNMCFFVDAMVAIEKGDFPKVQWYINQMTDQRMVEQNAKTSFNDFRTYSTTPVVRTSGLEQELLLAEAMEWELRAILALKTNKIDEAMENAKKAVELEEKTQYEPGPPVVLKPSYELYGEILIASAKYKEAIVQFDRALQRAPNRSLALLGKLQAMKKLGDHEGAAQIKSLLMKNWQNADEQARALMQ
ncbi:MAG: hypothetical protein HC819_19705 [Cyclobacteriaceae bacterium]|nr:hypothetical protein [Cyclobacteriaceae bacterium]